MPISAHQPRSTARQCGRKHMGEWGSGHGCAPEGMFRRQVPSRAQMSGQGWGCAPDGMFWRQVSSSTSSASSDIMWLM